MLDPAVQQCTLIDFTPKAPFLLAALNATMPRWRRYQPHSSCRDVSQAMGRGFRVNSACSCGDVGTTFAARSHSRWPRNIKFDADNCTTLISEFTAGKLRNDRNLLYVSPGPFQHGLPLADGHTQHTQPGKTDFSRQFPSVGKTWMIAHLC